LRERPPTGCAALSPPAPIRPSLGALTAPSR